MFGVSRKCAVLSRKLESGFRHPVGKGCVLCCVRSICGEDAHAYVSLTRRQEHRAERLCRIAPQLEDSLRRRECLWSDPSQVAWYIARWESVQRVEHAGRPLVALVLLGDDRSLHTNDRLGEDDLPFQDRRAARDLGDDRIIGARDWRTAERGNQDQRSERECRSPGRATRHLCAYFFLLRCVCSSDATIEPAKMLITTMRLMSGGTFQSWLMAGRIIFTPIHISTKARPVPR